MIEQWDTLVRLIAIGAALLLLAQVVAGELAERIRAPLVALILGAVAALITGLPTALWSGPLLPLVDLVALALPFAIWALGRTLLAAPPPQRAMLALAAAVLAGWAAGHFVTGAGTAAFGALHLIALGLGADLARVVLGGRSRGAVIGEREATALWLAALGAGIALQRVLAAIANPHGDAAAALDLAGALIVLVLILMCGLAFCRIDPALPESDIDAD